MGDMVVSHFTVPAGILRDHKDWHGLFLSGKDGTFVLRYHG